MIALKLRRGLTAPPTLSILTSAAGVTKSRRFGRLPASFYLLLAFREAQRPSTLISRRFRQGHRAHEHKAAKLGHTSGAPFAARRR